MSVANGIAFDGPAGAIPLARLPGDPLGQVAAARIAWALIALGIVARMVRFALCFPIWQDEAFLAANLPDRGYLDLAGPLANNQVAPLLFLWGQLTSIRLLGFSEYSLRLLPLLSGVGALVLFRQLAARLVQGTALVLSVGFLAVAYPAIRYSCEAKPYGPDLLAAVGLLYLAVRWWEEPERSRWLWALAAVAPLAVGASYPAVFVAGGTSLALAVRLWQGGSRASWIAWAACNAAIGSAFAALMLVSARHQSAATIQFMTSYWQNAFPPLGNPLKLAGWLVEVHASDMLAFPLGGRHGASALSLVCCLAAAWALVRRAQWPLLALLAAPLGLNFVAACLHRYPYGPHVRFAMYLAPAVCLLGGLGAAILLVRLGRSPRASFGLVAGVAAGLVLLAAGSVVRDVLKPYKNEEVREVRDFARTLWRDRAAREAVVCLTTDLGDPFAPDREGLAMAIYLCNQRIYSARIARGETLAPEAAPADAPLCCVFFSPSGQAIDPLARNRWLNRVESDRRLLGTESRDFTMSYDGYPVTDRIDLYEFGPRVERTAGGSRRTMEPPRTR